MDTLEQFQNALQSDFVGKARELMTDNKIPVLIYHADNASSTQSLNGHLTQLNLPPTMSIKERDDKAVEIVRALNEHLEGIIANLTPEAEVAWQAQHAQALEDAAAESADTPAAESTASAESSVTGDTQEATETPPVVAKAPPAPPPFVFGPFRFGLAIEPLSITVNGMWDHIREFGFKMNLSPAV